MWSAVLAPTFPLICSELRFEHFLCNLSLSKELNNLPRQLLTAMPRKLLGSLLSPDLCNGLRRSFFHSDGYKLNFKIVLNNSIRGPCRVSTLSFSISLLTKSKAEALLFFNFLTKVISSDLVKGWSRSEH